jgi:hypothetical protein
MAQSLAYAFFLNMWIMKRIDALFIEKQVNDGRITQAEAEMILATPQA